MPGCTRSLSPSLCPIYRVCPRSVFDFSSYMKARSHLRYSAIQRRGRCASFDQQASLYNTKEKDMSVYLWAGERERERDRAITRSLLQRIAWKYLSTLQEISPSFSLSLSCSWSCSENSRIPGRVSEILFYRPELHSLFIPFYLSQRTEPISQWFLRL